VEEWREEREAWMMMDRAWRGGCEFGPWWCFDIDLLGVVLIKEKYSF
jgi:hypothetical protein